MQCLCDAPNSLDALGCSAETAGFSRLLALAMIVRLWAEQSEEMKLSNSRRDWPPVKEAMGRAEWMKAKSS